jgi:hypothetical protein
MQMIGEVGKMYIESKGTTLNPIYATLPVWVIIFYNAIRITRKKKSEKIGEKINGETKK